MLVVVPAYGLSHLVMLGVFLAGLGPAYALGRARRSRDPGDRLTRALGALVLLVGVASTAYDAITDFTPARSLPLQLSDLAWVAAGCALWSRSRLVASATYFWSVLTLQSVLTPSLGQDFPDPLFVGFWALHLLTIWAAVLLVGGLRIVPGWRDYRRVLLATLVWAVVVLGFNVVADTNYGYLRRKPGVGSALDLFGPWPVYVLVASVILAALWAAMTWPWAQVRRPPREPPTRGVPVAPSPGR